MLTRAARMSEPAARHPAFLPGAVVHDSLNSGTTWMVIPEELTSPWMSCQYGLPFYYRLGDTQDWERNIRNAEEWRLQAVP